MAELTAVLVENVVISQVEIGEAGGVYTVRSTEFPELPAGEGATLDEAREAFMAHVEAATGPAEAGVMDGRDRDRLRGRLWLGLYEQIGE